jgi:HEAT repeat protein
LLNSPLSRSRPLFLVNSLRPLQRGPAQTWSEILSPRDLPDWVPDWVDEAIGNWSESNQRMMTRAETQRHLAADLLHSFGPDLAPAVPLLWQMYAQASSDDQAMLDPVLRAAGPNLECLLPELIGNLRNTNCPFRDECLSLLVAAGPKARPALPCLAQIGREGGSLSLPAALALWELDRQTNQVVDIFSRGLRSGGVTERIRSLRAFAKVLPAAQLAAPAIQKALLDPDPDVRDAATRLLQETDPESWRAAVRQCNCDPSPVLRLLIHSLPDAPSSNSVLAMKKIGLAGPLAEEAVPVLVKMLSPGRTGPLSSSIRRQSLEAAANALGRIGPASAPAAAPLADLLEHSGWNSHAYCRALGAIGPAARAAIPTLETLLNDSGRFVRLDAASALRQIAPQDNANTVPVLQALRGSDLPPVRCGAAVCLWQLGLETNLPLAELTAAVERRDARAIELAGDIGPPARDSLPALEKILGASDDARFTAAAAIERIDPDEARRLGLPGLLLLSCGSNGPSWPDSF